MTHQALFNKSVSGMASQGFEQSLDVEACVYLSKGGRRCTIGWLLPEGLDTSDFNTTRVSALEPHLLMTEDTDFLSSLQRCHDLGKDPETMKEFLRYLGQSYGLEMPKELRR